MGRWEPNARERLQQAAFELFQERGYADVTVAEIAERAGLTKRTFFNHFTDKREILFADSAGFGSGVLQHLADAGAELAPIDAAVAALTHGGRLLARFGELAITRRELIASSPDLQERNLIKMTSLTQGIADGLGARGVPHRTARFAAQAAVAAFAAAYDTWAENWAENPDADFGDLMRQALADLRLAIGGAQPARV